MIRFFKQIREELLKQKRVSRYIVYALGEIILIVVGILIAFSINNWQNNQEDRIKETAILKQLQTEFNSNLKQLDNKIDIRKDIINGAIKLIACLDDPKLRIVDSVNTYLMMTQSYPTFDPIINDLASTGSLRLILNDSLKQMLSYWTSELVQVKEEENAWVLFRNEVYRPYIIKHYQLRTMESDDLNPHSSRTRKSLIGGVQDTILYNIHELGHSSHNADLETLFNKPDFEDYLTNCITHNLAVNKQSFILRKRILDILDLLDQEIDKS